MALNKDLFGDLIPEKPKAVPVSVRKRNGNIRTFHISWNDTPPHELEPNANLHSYKEGNNMHPDVLHMGTRDAAMQIYRTHLHEYEIDPSVIDPTVYGDAQYVMDKANDPANGSYRRMEVGMRGLQPSLFESIPGDPRQAVRTGKVIQYRNSAEDHGSISYMIPKSAIESGLVRHVGVTDALEERKKAEPDKTDAEWDKQKQSMEKWKGLY